MKNISKIITLVSLIAATVSCNYLDVVPDNIATIEYAFRNRNEAEKYLYGVYSYRPAIGDVRSDPAMSGSDEIWQRYISLEWDRFTHWDGTKIRRGEQNVNQPISNLWDGNRSLWTGIRDCNIFLENIHLVRDIESTERNRWIAEAKFLKAYYHYCLMKRYGPIPIVDVNLPISAGVDEVQVYREPIDEVVNYISNLIMETIDDLPAANRIVIGTEAGRVDQAIALTIRAELLLFAASPLFNGNTDYASMVDNRGVQLFPQEYKPEKWEAAAEACKLAIETCHAQDKKLYKVVDPLTLTQPEPFQLQTTYRQAICDKWNSEMIWGGTNNDWNFLSRAAEARLIRLGTVMHLVTAELSPALKIVNQYYSSNGVPISEDKDWQNNGWYANRYRIRPELSSGDEIYYVKEDARTVYLHYNREPRFYASIGFDKGIYYGSGYNLFPDNVKHADFLNLGTSGFQGGDAYSATGYCAKKMHSFKNTQQVNQETKEYFPFPILRLADLYLMYAEALNEAYDTDEARTEAISYLDQVRERAGLEGVRESWQAHSINPQKPESQAGLREIIRQERTVELALEGKRFWDVRRWKEITQMNETPQGWNIMGETPEDFYNVMTLPRTTLRLTVKDYFWPIKESNLYVNKNLIQNYGW